MQLRHLRTFIAVADTLSFTRAAERIHLSQSSTTEQIKALEDDLGTLLFDRSRRKLGLTPAGERLLDHARELLRRAEEARRTVAGACDSNAGSLTIGGLETLCAGWLPSMIAAFRQRHPAVELKLWAFDSGQLRSGLRNGDLDIGFLFGEPTPTDGLRSEIIGEEELLIALPPGHRFATRASIEPDDLVGEPFLVTPQGCVYRRMFEEAFAHTRGPQIAGQVASFGTIHGLVEAGMGCALVPRTALSARHGPVPAVPWRGPVRTTPVTMLWRRRSLPPPAMAAFLAAAREHMTLQTSR